MKKDFAYHLTYFLVEYLPKRVGVSQNTIKAYRDVFSLLLHYISEEKGTSVAKITTKTLTAELITEFLLWLEQERGCSVSTRNQRLAAIQSFFKYLQLEGNLDELMEYQRVLGLPMKKAEKKTFNYFSPDGIKKLLEQPNTKTRNGRRDLVLLSVLYDTGARVQELVDLNIGDVRFTEPPTIRLVGKGNKARIVPIMGTTKSNLKMYLDELGNLPSEMPLFTNNSGKRLTRNGITYILDKYAEQARFGNESDVPRFVSPHVIRHSKAMHLLQAGVNLVYIRDLLGHVSVTTTEVYARADGKMKREALMKASAETADELAPWKQDADLMSWLKTLG